MATHYKLVELTITISRNLQLLRTLPFINLLLKGFPLKFLEDQDDDGPPRLSNYVKLPVIPMSLRT